MIKSTEGHIENTEKHWKLAVELTMTETPLLSLFSIQILGHVVSGHPYTASPHSPDSYTKPVSLNSHKIELASVVLV